MPTIVLVGGPAHGRLISIPEEQLGQSFYVAVPPPLEAVWLRPGEHEPVSAMEVRKVEYRFHRYDSWSKTWVYVVREEAKPVPRAVPPGGTWRWCRGCDVKWWGDEVCWCCEQPVTPPQEGWVSPPPR